MLGASRISLWSRGWIIEGWTDLGCRWGLAIKLSLVRRVMMLCVVVENPKPNLDARRGLRMSTRRPVVKRVSLWATKSFSSAEVAVDGVVGCSGRIGQLGGQMNRLRVLKQRAARGKAGVCRNPDGWYAAHGRGWGDCCGPLSRRQAIQLAARWGMPTRAVKIVITAD